MSPDSPSPPHSPMLDPASPMREMGPVDYLVIEFPGRRVASGEGLAMLTELVGRGIIRVLDLVFIGKQPDGTVIRIDPEAIAQHGHPAFEVFVGASSGLLDQSDIDAVADILQADSAAAMLVYENRWAAPFAMEMRRQGGQLVANGRIPIQSIVAALDAADAADAADGTDGDDAAAPKT